MKKINFELIFKIIVLIQLTIILIILISNPNSNNSNTLVEPNEVGRYKEIKIKCAPQFGGALEQVRILDTKTGQYVEP